MVIKMFNFLKRKSKNQLVVSPEQEELMWSNQNDDKKRTMLLSSTYYACMQIRCNALAKMPLKLLKRDEDGVKVYTDIKLYDLLKSRPNPYVNAHDFKWATEFMRLEYGNAYWVKEFVKGQVTALYLLDSRNVQIVYDNIGILSGENAVFYLYSDRQYGQQIYTEDEIVHLKNYSMDGIRGRSIKEYLADTINTEKSGQKVLKERYDKGLQDPLIVTFAGDLNENLQNKIKKKFESIGGTKSAGKVIPVPAEFKVEQLETKLVNSQFFQLQELTTRRIANAFGIKSFQLNDMSKSTYTNITEQNKAFYCDTIQNVVTTYEEEISYKLLTANQRNMGVYAHFNADVMLRNDTLSRYQAYQIAIQTGFMTIAEIRAMEDLSFIEGTDRLIIGNGASIPLSELGKQYMKGGDSKNE